MFPCLRAPPKPLPRKYVVIEMPRTLFRLIEMSRQGLAYIAYTCKGTLVPPSRPVMTTTPTDARMATFSPLTETFTKKKNTPFISRP